MLPKETRLYVPHMEPESQIHNKPPHKRPMTQINSLYQQPRSSFPRPQVKNGGRKTTIMFKSHEHFIMSPGYVKLYFMLTNNLSCNEKN